MDNDQFSRIARALADPTRMALLEQIASAPEVGCSVLAGHADVSQPTISHHLKELAAAGLVKPRRDAKFCFYSLDQRVWSAYLAELRRRVPSLPSR